MISENESYLLNQAKCGDAGAFEELVSLHYVKIYNFAFYLCKNSEDAKDISQQAIIKAYLSLKSFRGQASFATWLFKIVKNTFLDELKKLHRKHEHYLEETKDVSTFAAGETLDEKLRSDNLKAVIKEALSKMENDLSALIILKDIQGFEYQEIAEIFKIPVGTVKSRLHRAREILKNILKPQLDELL